MNRSYLGIMDVSLIMNEYKTIIEQNSDESYRLAFEMFSPYAESGDPAAMFNLGKLNHMGKGVKRDLDKAAEWMEKSVKAGFTRARTGLFDILWDVGTPQSFEKMIEVISCSANEGDASSVARLGKAYMFGRGVPKDPQKASELMIQATEIELDLPRYDLYSLLRSYYSSDDSHPKALNVLLPRAESGDPIAMFNLAGMYYRGNGMEKNLDKAAEWMEKSVKAGFTRARTGLFDILWDVGTPQSFEKMIEVISCSANEGDASSVARLGKAYMFGRGVPKDLHKAQELIAQAIKEGADWARNYLYQILVDSNNLKENFIKAAESVLPYAEYGDPVSMFNLGKLYYRGKGVKKNLNTAAEWMRKSAKAGFSQARTNLFDILWDIGNSKAFEEMIEIVKELAERGDASSVARLGKAYMFGKGVPKDPQKASELLIQAMSKGCYDCVSNYLDLEIQIDTEQSYLRFLKYYEKLPYSLHENVNNQNKLKLCVANLFSQYIKNKEYEKIEMTYIAHPAEVNIGLNTFIGFYFDFRRITQMMPAEYYQTYVYNEKYIGISNRFIPVYTSLKKKLKKILKFKKIKDNVKEWFLYWSYSFIKKQNNLWVFTGFGNDTYDNARYLFEYVSQKHPEITAYWKTKDMDTYNNYSQKGYNTILSGTKECKKIVSRASVVFTDHYRIWDYMCAEGFNNRTKVVQLWHGIGLKKMSSVDNDNITTAPGFVLSDDILVSPSDSRTVAIKKKMKYCIKAPFREKMENYYVFLSPSQYFDSVMSHPWHVGKESILRCGLPRNISLYNPKPAKGFQIIYAPTFRWSPRAESYLIDLLCSNLEIIEKTMSEVNGTLVLRLHPHTWRDYGAKLERLGDYPHIIKDVTENIYSEMSDYSIMISDYSSIAYDFLLMDRPVIFFNFDIDGYIQTDVDFNLDYDTYTPGYKTKTWGDTLAKIKEYKDNPRLHHEWRFDVVSKLYDLERNNEQDSERIVQAVLSKLSEE